MPSKKVSFALPNDIVDKYRDALTYLSCYIKNISSILRETSNPFLSPQGGKMESLSNISEGSLAEEDLRQHLVALFFTIFGWLWDARNRIKSGGEYLWWFQRITQSDVCAGTYVGAKNKTIIVSIASHFRVLDEDFLELLTEKNHKVYLL